MSLGNPKIPYPKADVTSAWYEEDQLAAMSPEPMLKVRVCPNFIICEQKECKYYKPNRNYAILVYCPDLGADFYRHPPKTVKRQYLKLMKKLEDENIFELVEVDDEIAKEDTHDARERVGIPNPS